jgi:hypothetical protein
VANQLLTRQEITFKSLMILKNNTVVLPNFYRDLDAEFGKKGGKIGGTIFVRKPPRAVGRDGAAYQPEGMTDTQVPVVINQQSGVDFEFGTDEKFLSIDDFANRYLEPYMVALANKLDLRSCLIAEQNTGNLVGTPGTTPGLAATDAFNTYASANVILDNEGFPISNQNRHLVVTPLMRQGWLVYTKQWFNPQDALARQWKTGQIDDALGVRWFVDQNLAVQTIGTLGGTPAVTTANQTGTVINANGASNNIATWAQLGDVISFIGVSAVNPQSRNSYGQLRNFAIQQVTSSDGSGNLILNIFPALVPTGQFQNVTAAPAAGALINVYNTAAAGQAALSNLSTPQGLMFHKQAFAFVSFPGDVPEGVDMGMEARSKEIGVSLRFVRIFDGYRDTWVNRFDVYYGIAPMYPEGACRIAG